jgi:hypothetical protein
MLSILKEDNNSNLNLTELFMAKAGDDWNRCYYGTIRRSHDENGNPIVYGKIKIGNEFIYATAADQWELGKKLDEMVLLILDYDPLETPGIGVVFNAN